MKTWTIPLPWNLRPPLPVRCTPVPCTQIRQNHPGACPICGMTLEPAALPQTPGTIRS
ncbi:MAG: heavy metal-binding domain-containing protein [Akkermansia sp.]